MPSDDLGDERARQRASGREPGRDHLLDVGATEPAELDQLHVVERPRRREAGARGEEDPEALRRVARHDLRAAHVLHEERRELERRRIGPVDVLEREHERPLARHAHEELDERADRQLLHPVRRERERRIARVGRQREEAREERHGLREVEAVPREQTFDRSAGEEEVDDRAERARLVLRDAACLDPFLGRDPPAELAEETGLPDPGLAGDEHGARPPVPQIGCRLEQRAQLDGPPDERRLAAPAGALARPPIAVPDEPEDPHGHRVRPRLDLAGRVRVEVAAEEAMRVGAHEDLAGVRALVEPRGELRREPHEIVETLVRRLAEPAHDDEPAVHARPRLEAEPALGLQTAGGAGRLPRDRERGARRAPGVVFARPRIPEDEEDTVGEHAGELPAGACRELGVDGVLRVERFVHLFRIDRTPRDGRDRQPAGHDGQLAALAVGQLVRPARLGPGRRLAVLDRREGLEEAGNRHVALLDLLRGDDLEQPAERVSPEPAGNRDRVRPELLPEHVRPRSTPECDLARETLEQHETPRVEVRARRRRLTAELLGRGVAGRPHELARLREPGQRPARGVLDEAAQTEVEHERMTPRSGLAQHDVVGLEVAVDDPVSVGAGERVEHLAHEPHRLADGKPTLGREHVAEGRAGNVLEDGVQHPVARLARVEETHDARVRHPGAELHLATEAPVLVVDVVQAVARVDAQDLDRDVPPGRELARLVDRGVAAVVDTRQDLVPALEDGPDRERTFVGRVHGASRARTLRQAPRR
jgi:hypothetical protein